MRSNSNPDSQRDTWDLSTAEGFAGRTMGTHIQSSDPTEELKQCMNM